MRITHFFRLIVLAVVVAALGGCDTTSDLRYGDKLVSDTEQWHASGGDPRKLKFLKTAKSKHGYYVIYSRYVRANTQNWKNLPTEIKEKFGSAVEQNDICGTGTDAKDVVRISDKDRTGLMMFTERNLTAHELKNFQAFKGVGTPVHFISLKDPSGSTRECLIDSSEYAATDLAVWDRDKEIPLTVAVGHNKADVSKIGNVLESVAAAANVVKAVVAPGTLVFNASGLRDVTAVGDKMNEFYMKETNYFQVVGDNIRFRTIVGSDKPWMRQFIPVYFQADENKEETKMVAGVVEFQFTVFSTRIEALIQDNGYPDFKLNNDSSFKAIDQEAEYKFGDSNFAKGKIVTAFIEWENKYKTESTAEAFDKACYEFVDVARTSFGYALIDQAAALDRVVTRHPKFKETIPAADIKSPDAAMDGALSINKKISALESEIAKADEAIAKLKSLNAFHSINCFKPFVDDLFTKLKLPIGERIATVLARLQSAKLAKKALNDQLSLLAGNPIKRANDLIGGLKGRFLKHIPDSPTRLSTEDLDDSFADTVKVRITAKGWDHLANTQDRSLDELRGDLEPLQALHLGCVSAAANPKLAPLFLPPEIEFVGLHIDHRTEIANKGVLLFAGEISDEANVLNRRINRLLVMDADMDAINAIDDVYDPTGSTCRTNQVIETAKQRLAN